MYRTQEELDKVDDEDREWKKNKKKKVVQQINNKKHVYNIVSFNITHLQKLIHKNLGLDKKN